MDYLYSVKTRNKLNTRNEQQKVQTKKIYSLIYSVFILQEQ
jgi:hypothetical protein